MNGIVAHMFWDEVLVFVVPVLFVLTAVRWAERRRPPGDDVPSGAGGDVTDEPARAEPTESD